MNYVYNGSMVSCFKLKRYLDCAFLQNSHHTDLVRLINVDFGWASRPRFHGNTPALRGANEGTPTIPPALRIVAPLGFLLPLDFLRSFPDYGFAAAFLK